MNSFRSSLRKLILGVTLPQEYVCIGKEPLANPLKVMLRVSPGMSLPDVSPDHLFLGYKPLIIGIPFEKGHAIAESLSAGTRATLVFTAAGGKKVAELTLMLLDRKYFAAHQLLLFEGAEGTHHFLSAFHQWMNRIRERLAIRSANNVNLDRKLYDQVRIAYSIPRLISIVTVSDGHLFNMFPTDLNGRIGDHDYVISLRHGGLANKQVEEAGKVCLACIGANGYRMAYALGANHMQPLKAPDKFEFAATVSERFAWPLPPGVASYRELELKDSKDFGIHRLHFFRVLNEKKINEDFPLTHIHRYYAEWNIKQGNKDHYLIR